ncbi:MAG: UPF0175 family protein, partial [Nanoarchaeota archaeon]
SEPIKGKTWLQKELFLISKIDNSLSKELDFKPHHYGPHSYNAQYDLEDLETEGLIIVIDGEIHLTDEGYHLFDEIKKTFNEDILNLTSETKKFLNDLSMNELLSYIYQNNKDMTIESVVVNRLKKNLIEYAVNLYKKKKISLSSAAKISDLSVEQFVEKLKQKNIKIELR